MDATPADKDDLECEAEAAFGGEADETDDADEAVDVSDDEEKEEGRTDLAVGVTMRPRGIKGSEAMSEGGDSSCSSADQLR